jgi:hypothetical protein
MPDDDDAADTIVPITGRRLALPPGPIFALQRAADRDYEIGAFRAWAGYKNLGTGAATDGLALFQHVIAFGRSEGRTGVHCHLAHAHIVIPTSGRSAFIYDGLAAEALPGAVIVQHGGTVHDQFDHSFAGGGVEANKLTPVSLEPRPDASTQSFGFLELFVPARFANVEIVAPADVTADDAATAWDHPYHAPSASYALQSAADGGAAYSLVAGQPQLEARDCHTWAPSGELVATWIVRSRSEGAGREIALHPPGESGGLQILFMAGGAASFERAGEESLTLAAGDCLTCTAGLVGLPRDPTPDMRMVLLHLSSRAEQLRERTPAEIAQVEALGPKIITRRLVRPAHDDRPVNFLRDEDPAPV